MTDGKDDRRLVRATTGRHFINNQLAVVLTNLEVAIEQVAALEGTDAPALPCARLVNLVDALGDAKHATLRISEVINGE